MYLEKNKLYKIVIHNSLFSPEECQKIIDVEGNFIDSTTQLYDKFSHYLNYKPIERFTNKNARKSKSKELDFTDNNAWIFERFTEFTNKANEEYFHLNIQNYIGTQIIKYEKDDFFNIHVDIGAGEIANRKLSLIVFLSERKDYEGGQLKWFPEIQLVKQLQGTMVIFPSYFPHLVEPVIKGTRYVLVSWGCD